MTSASKTIEFGEMTQNKGYYAVQGHSRSSLSIPVESPYALCVFLLVINTDILSRTISKLSQTIFRILNKKRPLCVFVPPLGGLDATYSVHLRLIGKLVVYFLYVFFSLDVTSEALRANIDWRSKFLKGWVSFSQILM